MPKRYDKMTREERIEDSDKEAVRKLVTELTTNIKKKPHLSIDKSIEEVVRQWIKNRQLTIIHLSKVYSKRHKNR